MNVIDIALLLLLLAASVWIVITPDLMRAVLALALASVMLTLVLFQWQMPLAGVFELSVCAGLVTVVFISAISLAPIQNPEAVAQAARQRWRRYIWLPILLVGAGLWLFSLPPVQAPVLAALPDLDMRAAIWMVRRFDLIGQMLVILAGVFGVVVLFKTRKAEAPTTPPESER